MRRFAELNPVTVFIFYVAAAGIAMFCFDPAVLVISLAGSALYYFASGSSRGMGFHLACLGVLLLSALINPLFYHNGVTVLFVMNDNPVTLEALSYGVSAGVMLAGTLYWFASFSHIMTSDKLLYLFGRVSPKLALILSMVLRYIPLFGAQAKKVSQTQKALGLYTDGNTLDAIRGGVRVFSIMVTWSLENGIITADSMTARGYGIGRRTSFSTQRFTASDAAVLTATLLFAALTLTGFATGACGFTFYPKLSPAAITPLSAAAYAAYALLSLLPSICEFAYSAVWRSRMKSVAA